MVLKSGFSFLSSHAISSWQFDNSLIFNKVKAVITDIWIEKLADKYTYEKGERKTMRLLSGLVALLVQYVIFAGIVLAGNIVINEFDLNPAGKDAGNEWVVLYNPSEVEVDISSWTFETTHGRTVTVRIPQGTTMPPKGYWTYTHSRQWLDNEDELIILKDAEAIEVDRTQVTRDTDNDNRYWTRYPDGLDTNSDSDWRFRKRVLSKGIIRSETVKYVEDGDTIDVIFAPENKDIRGIQRIRLVGIDTPELDTPEGKKVKDLVEKMCLGKVVKLEVDDERQYDKYYRILAVIYINGLNLNAYLLKEGYARPLVILPSEFIPYASFIYSPEEPPVNQIITFDASSSYSLDPDAVITSYKWNFGDGTMGEGKVINHSYSSAGDYTVTFTVVDSDGKAKRENIRIMRITIKKE